MAIPDSGFTSEQQEYLAGFFTGIQQRPAGMPFLGQNEVGQFTGDPGVAVEEETVFGTPVEDLCREEAIKHENNGLDSWSSLTKHAAAGSFPPADDVFRFKFHGLFYVSPAQDSYMLRCRIPGGVLSSYQMRGIGTLAEKFGGGYADVTTRGNLQIREIMPENTVNILQGMTDLGLTARGSGADNIRNITASPTTGFDPDEVCDVMPLAKAMHHYILNHRDLYGLPRKFNISFDSGGAISVCADTNDIAFYAVRVTEAVDGIEPGVYFRMQLCGITGHKQFATDSGVLLTPEETIPVAAALIRVFIENGDRTNRKKARLKYLVDQWGIPKTLEETAKKLAFTLRFLPLEACEASRPKVKHGHVGVYRQKDGNNYLGVVIPVGRMQASQVKEIAAIADRFGQGEIRLTVWQNLIIPHIPDEDLPAAKQAIVDAGFNFTSTSVSGGLIACTGNTGCKFANANTKGNAVDLAKYLEGKIELDQPINIHLTGCPHSCAQHYIGDIGLQGVKVKNDLGETVEGYNVVLGGGVDDDQFIAREVFKAVPGGEMPGLIEGILRGYLAERVGRETFAEFTRRVDVEVLKELFAVAV